MYKRKSVNYAGVRKKVAKLFYAVLTKKMPVREALIRFPRNCDDKTLIASWHALCHFEADEDLRAKDALYKEVQDNYIEFIARTLQEGNELPENIINPYIEFYGEELISDSKTPQGIWHKLKRFICC